MSAVVSSVEGGALGSTSLAVTADADLGEGVKPISASEGVVVGASEATGISFEVGAPEDRPQP